MSFDVTLSRADTLAIERALLAEIKRQPKDGSFVERTDIAERTEAMGSAMGASSRKPTRGWVSRDFVVQLFEFEAFPRLSVQRAGACRLIRPQKRDLRPISWDELMRVKDAIGFGDAWAVEVFPPTCEVIDVAPMRHLWILPTAPPYAWRKGTAGYVTEE